MKTYRFNYSPADKDGYSETEFCGETLFEAVNAFEDFCKTDLQGYNPESLDICLVNNQNDIEVYSKETKASQNEPKTVSLKCNGGTLKAYVYNDGCAEQAGICYIPDGDTAEIDICLAEVKGPELSSNPNNQNIDIYVWDDPYTEDYTISSSINYKDIGRAVNGFKERFEEVRAVGIRWDVDEDGDGNRLPTIVKVPDNYVLESDYDEDALSEVVSDWLSDEYGFCHDGFSLKFLTNDDLKAEEEKLKKAIYDSGVNAVEDFLGHPLDSDSINIRKEMDDCIAQMPDDVYFTYLKDHNIL